MIRIDMKHRRPRVFWFAKLLASWCPLRLFVSIFLLLPISDVVYSQGSVQQGSAQQGTVQQGSQKNGTIEQHAADEWSDIATDPLYVDLAAIGQSVVVTLHNAGSVPVSVLTWGTPFAGALDGDVLRIRDTEILSGLDYELSYSGLLFKRGDPLQSDFVTVGAGQAVTASIALADYYAVDVASTYEVGYRGLIRYSEGTNALQNSLRSFEANSNTVKINLQVRPDTRAALPPAFSSCSISQQAVIESSLLAAERITGDALSALRSLGVNQRSSSPRYAHWFGNYTETRFNFVSAGYANLQSALANTQIDFLCGCTRANTYAFVNRNRPFEINLCPVFWTTTETGTDSRAGTIVHELSHFFEIIGTDDFQYGQQLVAELALTDPDRSILNADSYEYFAENTPVIPIAASDSELENGFVQLQLDVERGGSLIDKQSHFYSVTGAESVELTSVGGDADLFVYQSIGDQDPVCESRTTASLDECSLETLPTAVVEVFGFTAGDYRVVARSGLVAVVQSAGTVISGGGNASASAGAGSTGATLLLAGLLAVCFRCARRRRNCCSRHRFG